jgi:DNA-binding transcriptional MerR regulator
MEHDRYDDWTMAEKPEELTIDQLAQKTGMTVRNIRAHQSRGLLPPPEVRGRTGYYGPDHVARIELIKEMQAEGFNLELIRRLVDTAARGSEGQLLRFTRGLREPFGDEQPELVDLAELAKQWGANDPRLIERAEELGLLRSLGNGRYEEVSPRLMRAGTELAEFGVSAREALDILARLRRHADGVATSFVRLFFDLVWKPFDEAGRPPERWAEVSDALERLRPLAAESLMAVFQLAMDDAVETAVGRELEGEVERHRRRSARRRTRSRPASRRAATRES